MMIVKTRRPIKLVIVGPGAQQDDLAQYVRTGLGDIPIAPSCCK